MEDERIEVPDDVTTIQKKVKRNKSGNISGGSQLSYNEYSRGNYFLILFLFFLFFFLIQLFLGSGHHDSFFKGYFKK